MLSWLGLLLAATHVAKCAVIFPGRNVAAVESQPTCACTQTVTQLISANVGRRQDPCPAPPAPLTVTITVAPPKATMVGGDSSSVSSYFASVAGIDTIVIENSSQDRPISEPPETTPIFFTHTAAGPAVFGTDDPDDGVTLYHFESTGKAPVATTTVSFPPAGPVVTDVQWSATGKITDSRETEYAGTVTVTTYLSTVTITPENTTTITSTPSNLSVTARHLQKRQTCSMVFAIISGEWASWCNNWDGSKVFTQSTFNATVLVTHPVGAPPIPVSVYNPSGTSSGSTTSEEATSTSLPTSIPKPPSGPTSTTIPSSIPKPPTSSTTVTSKSKSYSGTTSVVITATAVVTYPVTTITQTFSDAKPEASSLSISSTASSTSAASSSCGQIGQFVIKFDDLPVFSTNNPNETASPPIFDPYDHFYWTSGYGYGPPPDTPYAPHDGSRLAMYDPVGVTESVAADTEGRDLPGSFGAGRRVDDNVFWFDAQSAYIGCNGTNTEGPCSIVVTGYQWVVHSSGDNTTNAGHEVALPSQEFSAPALCVAPPCSLTQVFFDYTKFSGLSSINILVSQAGRKVGFFLDSFEAKWTNNSCEAGLERQSSRK